MAFKNINANVTITGELDATVIKQAGVSIEDLIPNNTAIECIWNGSAWVTLSGEAVPTDVTKIRVYSSLDDPAAATPTYYNNNDKWHRALS